MLELNRWLSQRCIREFIVCAIPGLRTVSEVLEPAVFLITVRKQCSWVVTDIELKVPYDDL